MTNHFHSLYTASFGQSVTVGNTVGGSWASLSVDMITHVHIRKGGLFELASVADGGIRLTQAIKYSMGSLYTRENTV